MTDKRTVLLGMNCGTASNRLRKLLMFSFMQKLNMDKCFRCGELISDVASLSIEHKKPWMAAENPPKAFFDLDNISFSHLSCNSGAAIKPNKVYSSEKDQIRSSEKRRRGRRIYNAEYRHLYYLEKHR